MTLILTDTQNNDVAAGFAGLFADYFLFGSHCFSTKGLCEFLSHMANNPESRLLRMRAYPAETFERLMNEFYSDYLPYIYDAVQGPDKETGRIFLEASLEHHDLHIEDKLEKTSEGFSLPVKIVPEQDIVYFFMHGLHTDTFALMAHYAVHGGLTGWSQQPEFAKNTMHSIKQSANPVFANIKDRISVPVNYGFQKNIRLKSKDMVLYG